MHMLLVALAFPFLSFILLFCLLDCTSVYLQFCSQRHVKTFILAKLCISIKISQGAVIFFFVGVDSVSILLPHLSELLEFHEEEDGASVGVEKCLLAQSSRRWFYFCVLRTGRTVRPAVRPARSFAMASLRKQR